MSRWIKNPYWQYFTGQVFFQNKQPFDPSEFVHFRKRLQESGLELLLSQTVSLHSEAKKEKEVQIDTTVMEKNTKHKYKIVLFIFITPTLSKGEGAKIGLFHICVWYNIPFPTDDKLAKKGIDKSKTQKVSFKE